MTICFKDYMGFNCFARAMYKGLIISISKLWALIKKIIGNN